MASFGAPRVLKQTLSLRARSRLPALSFCALVTSTRLPSDSVHGSRSAASGYHSRQGLFAPERARQHVLDASCHPAATATAAAGLHDPSGAAAAAWPPGGCAHAGRAGCAGWCAPPAAKARAGHPRRQDHGPSRMAPTTAPNRAATLGAADPEDAQCRRPDGRVGKEAASFGASLPLCATTAWRAESSRRTNAVQIAQQLGDGAGLRAAAVIARCACRRGCRTPGCSICSMKAWAPPFASAMARMLEITCPPERPYMARMWLNRLSKCSPSRASASSQMAGACVAASPAPCRAGRP